MSSNEEEENEDEDEEQVERVQVEILMDEEVEEGVCELRLREEAGIGNSKS